MFNFDKTWLSLTAMALGLTLALVACDRSSKVREAMVQGSQSAGASLPAGADELAICRPGDGRLVGFAWSPPGSECPAARGSAIARRIARRLERERNATTLRAWAAESMVTGRWDDAVSALADAVELSPGDSAAWSDLAAARLGRAAAASDAFDLYLALVAANRAVEIEPGLRPAAFNRALALERLSLLRETGEQWFVAARGEPDPGWHGEIVRRAAASKAEGAGGPAWPAVKAEILRLAEREDRAGIAAIVTRFPQQCREWLEEELLLAAIAANQGGDPARCRRIALLGAAVADALVRVNGSRVLGELYSELHLATAGGTRHADRLLHGFRAYATGLSQAKRGSFVRALPRLEIARRVLAGERSPLSGWAAYWQAYCHYQRSEYHEALGSLLTLAVEAGRTGDPALRGKALSLAGLIQLIEGSATASLVSFESARSEFDAAHETANAAKAVALVARNLDYLGRSAEAWRLLHPALHAVTPGEPLIRSGICEAAAVLSLEDGQPGIALWFQDEVLAGALATGADYAVADALRSRGAILAALGRKDQAQRDLDEARQRLRGIGYPLFRRSLEGDLLRAQGELVRAESPVRALPLLTSAVELFRSTSYHFALAQALYDRALVERALGAKLSFENDLRAALAECERQRTSITPFEQRVAYFERTRAMLDTMIDLQLERGRSDLALSYSEDAKARALLDWLNVQPLPEQTRVRLSSQAASGNRGVPLENLPPGVAVVEYASLPGHLAIWIVRRGQAESISVALDAQSLTSLVDRFVRALRRDSRQELIASSMELYDAVLRPVEHLLRPGERLVFIPDGALHAVPFALLRDRRTSRFLVEDRVSSVAPSVRTFVSALANDRARVRMGSRVLVLSDPAFDTTLYPALERLPAGQREATIVRSFPGSKMLTGDRATRQAFLALAGEFEILYFGGHSIVNREFPLLSQMVFAANGADPSRGVLHAGELLGQHFGHTRLAVLASCATAGGRVDRTEGVESLVRPFLATGVPAVIGALWKVDDEATAEFFLLFFRKLHENLDTAVALRATQLELLARWRDVAGKPDVWGAFELFGANYSAPSPSSHSGTSLPPRSGLIRQAPCDR